jgi:type II secretory pathway pseudopilin PulG
VMKRTSQQSGGYILLTVLVAAMILSTLGAIAAQALINNSRFTQFNVRQDKALQVAEAGINYYLWHLAHNPTDYTDGSTTTPPTAPYGPYSHTYYDNNGTLVGTYSLYITPPTNGSTVTTVKAIGTVPNLTGGRTILAQLGQPSFANYALLSNAEVWFGATESSNGPVQSNIGVHFDGVNNGPVMAGQATYKTDGFHCNSCGAGSTHPGVWGTGGPTSQWQFPVPSVNFTSISANLQTLQTLAQSNGIYLGASGSKGYALTLRSDSTIDIYKVTNETFNGSTATGLTKTFIRNQAAPANGIVSVNDNVWVSGTNWPGRITIVAATLPSNSGTNRSINVIDNLTYAAKDGTAAIGLIAQKDVQVSDYAPSNIELDAAVLAQSGNVFVSSNAPVKSAITFYGSIADYSLWTWGWVDGSNVTTAGYPTTTTNFDTHLIYAPPPQYPTTGTYSILNWREQLYAP